MWILGIDTGGTYTDGVIIDRETKEIHCEAKALTTPEQLSIGIENCICALKFFDWDKVELVCLSTTLATNAVVEGKSCSTGVILLGKEPKGEIPAKRKVVIDSQVNIRGNVQERIHPDEILRAAETLSKSCEAIAVSGYASVRNPVQEQEVKRIIQEKQKIPVVCGHELTGTLGFYERTVTAVLNAGLIPIIQELMHSIEGVMEAKGIKAPVMVMRGDGSLMRASYALQRPIETVLSGPAASVVGGMFLSGLDHCQVIDIGGTTTDIAYVKDGNCRISKEGAVVSGWHTRVRAMEICTFGLGGDSAIRVGDDASILIGPQKIMPYCRRSDGNTKAGLTPTDILHASGEFEEWNRQASRKAIREVSEKLNLTPESVITTLKDAVYAQLETYCSKSREIFAIEKNTPVVGVGAPAKAWVSKNKTEGQDTVIPPHASIANAVGAAVGRILETTEVLIRRNKRNKTYLVFTEKQRIQVESLVKGRTTGRELGRKIVMQKAREAGADEMTWEEDHRIIQDKQGNWIEECIHITVSGNPTAGRRKE
ncbi:MAG: hydantoinase/oxoprolinase family protein [Eubacteriales bacterium]|nr:hydantoinase/oxoprolinase family protein [Eubacteriales bacterium]